MVARLAWRGVRALVGPAALVWCLGMPVEGRAQEFDRVEVQGGGGYLSGQLDEGATWKVGAVLWPSERWGFAVHRVDGPFHDPDPIPGYTDTEYWTLTARYRRHNSLGIEFNIGIGLLVGHNNRGDYSGFPLEFFMGRKFTPHLGFKAGVTGNVSIFDSPNFLHTQGFLFLAF